MVTYKLISPIKEMVDAWEAVFVNRPGIEIHHGDIRDFQGDAIVSPANCFGFMDGGIDQFTVISHSV